MIQQLVLNGIIAGGIYSLIALGFAIIYRTTKFFNFAHGAIYALGAYLAYSLIRYLGLNNSISFLIVIIICALIAICIDRLVYSRLRKKHSPNFAFLLASFGVFIIIQNLVQLVFGAQILTLRTGPIREGYHFLGAVITSNQITIIFFSLLLFILSWILIQKTKFGKAIRSVSDDSVAASLVGIKSEKIIALSVALGSALAGAAGILISIETNIEPTMGFNAILKGIIASIIGGMGSIPGALLGGFFLGLAENLGIWQIQAGWKDAIAFVILILFLLLRPSGIMGVKTEKEKL